MPWLTHNKQCDCKPPEGPFHSAIRLNIKSIWQCPKCNHLWKINPYSSTHFKEHKLGENDYWYMAEFQQSY